MTPIKDLPTHPSFITMWNGDPHNVETEVERQNFNLHVKFTFENIQTCQHVVGSTFQYI